MTSLRSETIWVMCASCGHERRKHRILHQKVVELIDEPGSLVYAMEFHRFVECLGCERTKYVVSTLECMAPDAEEHNFKIYPDAPGTTVRRRPLISSDDASGGELEMLVPGAVWKMYKETMEALNANIRTLAGAGLRAVVEAICLDKRIGDGPLHRKIGDLAKQNLLTTAQADLLHEERYLGNAALHELATPSVQEIEDGLGIIEGLINTIYILPSKAKRLKDRRTAKSKRTPVPAKKLKT